jgi:hypothetical protein
VTDLSYPSLFMQGFYWLERHPAPLLGRAHLRPGCKVSHLHCAEADCVNGARAHMALLNTCDVAQTQLLVTQSVESIPTASR